MVSINIYRQVCRFCAVLGLVLGLVHPLFAENTPLFLLPQGALYGGLGGPEDPVPAKVDLRTGKLPNGLRYYILENSLPSGRAYLTLAVNAGSVLENDDERGFAHFVEHVAFCGTSNFPGNEVTDYLRSLGMRFGPEVNAYTSFDETVYGIEAPTEQGNDGIKRIPARALAILDDWTHAVTFAPEAVEKEKAIILEEYRSRLGAQERVRRQLLPLIFQGSRYAERLPIGLPNIIQNATAEQLKDFYRRWYRPDNMAVILVGDFDGAALEKELAGHFSAPAPETQLVRPEFDLPEPQKGALTTALISDPELPASIVYLYFKRSSLSLERTLKTYRNDLIDYLIEMMIDFRFGEKINSGDTPYVGTGSWGARYGTKSRYYTMAAQAKAGRSEEALEALLLEKERLVRYGFIPAELDRAKRAFLANLEMMEAEKDRRESEEYLNDLTADFLHEQFALDLDWELDAARALLPAIGLLMVNSTVRSYFADDDLKVFVTAPDAEADALLDAAKGTVQAEVTDGRDSWSEEQSDWPGRISAMIEKIRAAELEPPGTKTAALGPVSEVPKPGEIAIVRDDETGAEHWHLSNGMEVILMETANKNNELEFYALAKGGTTSAAELLADRGFSPATERFSAELAAEIQGASGLGNLSRAELMDFLSGKQVTLAFWAGAYTRGIRGASSVKDLPVLFELLYASFTQPRIDQAGVQRILDYYKTRLLQEADNPEAIFSRELTRLIYNNHPLLIPMEREDLDQVSEKAALEFLTLALHPASYTLVLAGSLGDRKELRSLVETWLASIPVEKTYTQRESGDVRTRLAPYWNEWTTPELKRPKKAEKVIHKGKEDKANVYMGWYAPKLWGEADNAAALVLNEYLDIVLTDEIREALGGVYSISSRASFSIIPTGELSLGIYFVCGPSRQAELRDAVREQLASVAGGTIDGETLNRAKEALVKSFERSVENNAFIARNLATFAAITGEPLSHFAQRPALYRSVTAENIRLITAELLAGDYVELILLPEESIEK